MSATDPRHFEVREKLRNGTAVTIRALRPDDRERMRAAFARLSPTTVYMRTFSHRKGLTEDELRRYVEIDFNSTVALVVTAGETVIAGGRYIRDVADSAEVAFTVDGSYQRLGIGSRLLGHLAVIARERGIQRFFAEVLAENASMLAVFARSGLRMERRRDSGVVHVTLDLSQ